MDIKTNTVQGKKFGIFIPFGKNRAYEFQNYCGRVWDKFGIEVNFVECEFPLISHGYVLNRIISQSINWDIDYIVFSEIDCVPLVPNILELVYDKIKDNKTIFGIAQASNHKKSNNGELYSPYVGPAFAAFSKELYLKLNRPDFDHSIPRSDTLEEMSYIVKKKGFIISLIYPSFVFLENCNLDGDCAFGLGNKYCDLIYHSSFCSDPMSLSLFVNECKKILE